MSGRVGLFLGILVAIAIILILITGTNGDDGSAGLDNPLSNPNCTYVEAFPGDKNGKWECGDTYVPKSKRRTPAPTSSATGVVITAQIINGKDAFLYPTTTPHP